MSVDAQFAVFVERNLHHWVGVSAKLDEPTMHLLSAEYENVLRAIQFGLSQPTTVESACHLQIQLFDFFQRHGYWQQGIALYHRAIELLPSNHQFLARMHDLLGSAYNDCFEHPLSIKHHTIALKTTTDKVMMMRVHAHLANVYVRANQFSKAETAIAEAKQFLTVIDNPPLRLRSALFNAEGLVAQNKGLFVEAEHAFRTSLAGWRTLGHIGYVSNVLMNLALVLFFQNRAAESFVLYDEAMQLLKGSVNQFRRIKVASNKAVLLNRLGATEEAYKLWVEQDTPKLRAHYDPLLKANLHTNIAVALITLDRAGEAIAYLDLAESAWKQTGDGMNIANLLGERGRANLQLGNIEEGVRQLKQAIEMLGSFPNNLTANMWRDEFEEMFDKWKAKQME